VTPTKKKWLPRKTKAVRTFTRTADPPLMTTDGE
jgi:hypothetical protein